MSTISPRHRRPLLALLALLVALVVPATASAADIGNITLNDQNWKTLGQQGGYISTGTAVEFRWLPTYPGKTTSIRITDCYTGEPLSLNERIEAGDGSYHLLRAALPETRCFKVQGRLPTGGGTMANPHTARIHY